MRTPLSALLVVCLVAVAGDAGAAQPKIVNGQVTTRAVGASLPADLSSLAAADRGVFWIGYAVPGNRSGAGSCCRTTWDGGGCACCTLETGDRAVRMERNDTAKVASLEGSGEIAVFARFDAGVTGRVAAYSAGCDIDAGGRRVVWLTGVTPASSLAWLETVARAQTGERHGRDGAVMAIALHADAAADQILERMALGGGPARLAESAVFWMGVARGRAGFEGVRRVLDRATDEGTREKAVFAVSVSEEPGATAVLLDLAKSDRSAGVRGQAIFWLGQKAGAKVADAIVGAVKDDPDTEVKKRAVFALSQLPKDEGVPRLIDVARTNRSAEVRKQAMFWLGQSKDPRALAFFEEVLR